MAKVVKRRTPCPPIVFVPTENTQILNGKTELDHPRTSELPQYKQLKNEIQEQFGRKVRWLCYTDVKKPDTSLYWAEREEGGWVHLDDAAEGLHKITSDAELAALMKAWQRDKPNRMRRKAKGVLAQVAKQLASKDEDVQLHALVEFTMYLHGTSEPVPDPLSLISDTILQALLHNFVRTHKEVQTRSCRIFLLICRKERRFVRKLVDMGLIYTIFDALLALTKSDGANSSSNSSSSSSSSSSSGGGSDKGDVGELTLICLELLLLVSVGAPPIVHEQWMGVLLCILLTQVRQNNLYSHLLPRGKAAGSTSSRNTDQSSEAVGNERTMRIIVIVLQLYSTWSFLLPKETPARAASPSPMKPRFQLYSDGTRDALLTDSSGTLQNTLITSCEQLLEAFHRPYHDLSKLKPLTRLGLDAHTVQEVAGSEGGSGGETADDTHVIQGIIEGQGGVGGEKGLEGSVGAELVEGNVADKGRLDGGKMRPVDTDGDGDGDGDSDSDDGSSSSEEEGEASDEWYWMEGVRPAALLSDLMQGWWQLVERQKKHADQSANHAAKDAANGALGGAIALELAGGLSVSLAGAACGASRTALATGPSNNESEKKISSPMSFVVQGGVDQSSNQSAGGQQSRVREAMGQAAGQDQRGKPADQPDYRFHLLSSLSGTGLTLSVEGACLLLSLVCWAAPIAAQSTTQGNNNSNSNSSNNSNSNNSNSNNNNDDQREKPALEVQAVRGGVNIGEVQARPVLASPSNLVRSIGELCDHLSQKESAPQHLQHEHRAQAFALQALYMGVAALWRVCWFQLARYMQQKGQTSEDNVSSLCSCGCIFIDDDGLDAQTGRDKGKKGRRKRKKRQKEAKEARCHLSSADFDTLLRSMRYIRRKAVERNAPAGLKAADGKLGVWRRQISACLSGLLSTIARCRCCSARVFDSSPALCTEAIEMLSSKSPQLRVAAAAILSGLATHATTDARRQKLVGLGVTSELSSHVAHCQQRPKMMKDQPPAAVRSGALFRSEAASITHATIGLLQLTKHPNFMLHERSSAVHGAEEPSEIWRALDVLKQCCSFHGCTSTATTTARAEHAPTNTATSSASNFNLACVYSYRGIRGWDEGVHNVSSLSYAVLRVWALSCAAKNRRVFVRLGVAQVLGQLLLWLSRAPVLTFGLKSTQSSSSQWVLSVTEQVLGALWLLCFYEEEARARLLLLPHVSPSHSKESQSAAPVVAPDIATSAAKPANPASPAIASRTPPIIAVLTKLIISSKKVCACPQHPPANLAAVSLTKPTVCTCARVVTHKPRPTKISPAMSTGDRDGFGQGMGATVAIFSMRLLWVLSARGGQALDSHEDTRKEREEGTKSQPPVKQNAVQGDAPSDADSRVAPNDGDADDDTDISTLAFEDLHVSPAKFRLSACLVLRPALVDICKKSIYPLGLRIAALKLQMLFLDDHHRNDYRRLQEEQQPSLKLSTKSFQHQKHTQVREAAASIFGVMYASVSAVQQAHLVAQQARENTQENAQAKHEAGLDRASSSSTVTEGLQTLEYAAEALAVLTGELQRRAAIFTVNESAAEGVEVVFDSSIAALGEEATQGHDAAKYKDGISTAKQDDGSPANPGVALHIFISVCRSVAQLLPIVKMMPQQQEQEEQQPGQQSLQSQQPRHLIWRSIVQLLVAWLNLSAESQSNCQAWIGAHPFTFPLLAYLPVAAADYGASHGTGQGHTDVGEQSVDSRVRALCAAILQNLSRHVDNRTRLWKLELKLGSKLQDMELTKVEEKGVEGRQPWQWQDKKGVKASADKNNGECGGGGGDDQSGGEGLDVNSSNSRFISWLQLHFEADADIHKLGETDGEKELTREGGTSGLVDVLGLERVEYAPVTADIGAVRSPTKAGLGARQRSAKGGGNGGSGGSTSATRTMTISSAKLLGLQNRAQVTTGIAPLGQALVPVLEPGAVVAVPLLPVRPPPSKVKPRKKTGKNLGTQRKTKQQQQQLRLAQPSRAGYTHGQQSWDSAIQFSQNSPASEASTARFAPLGSASTPVPPALPNDYSASARVFVGPSARAFKFKDNTYGSDFAKPQLISAKSASGRKRRVRARNLEAIVAPLGHKEVVAAAAAATAPAELGGVRRSQGSTKQLEDLTLCRFPVVEGSKVHSGLFPTYKQPDGTSAYYFKHGGCYELTTDMVHALSDPPPLTLSSIHQDVFNGAAVSLSPLPIAPVDLAAAADPPLWAHLQYMSHPREDGGSHGIKPMLIRDDTHMVLHFQAAEWTPDPTPPPSPPRWSLAQNTRVWRPRMRESESKDFYDNVHSNGKAAKAAFKKDVRRLMRKQIFHSYLTKAAIELGGGENSMEADMAASVRIAEKLKTERSKPDGSSGFSSAAARTKLKLMKANIAPGARPSRGGGTKRLSKRGSRRDSKGRGGKEKSIMTEWKQAMESYYQPISDIFRYYSALAGGGKGGGDSFTLSLNSFNQFLMDLGIRDEQSTYLRSSAMDSIFVAVNLGAGDVGNVGEKEAKEIAAESRINNKHAFMRFQFLECFTRLAIEKYVREARAPTAKNKTDKLRRASLVAMALLSPRSQATAAKNEAASPKSDEEGDAGRKAALFLINQPEPTPLPKAKSIADAMEFLLKREVRVRLDDCALLSTDIFRHDRLYTEDMDTLLYQQLLPLKSLFARYAPRKKEEIGRKREEISMSQFFALLGDLEWVDNAFTQRDAVLCFVRGKLQPSDEFDSFLKERASFMDFLEILARIAASKPLPTMAQVKAAGAANPLEYAEWVASGRSDEQGRPLTMMQPPPDHIAQGAGEDGDEEDEEDDEDGATSVAHSADGPDGGNDEGHGKGAELDTRKLELRVTLLLSMLYTRLSDETLALTGKGTIEPVDQRFRRTMAQAAKQISKHLSLSKRWRTVRMQSDLARALAASFAKPDSPQATHEQEKTHTATRKRSLLHAA
jgi:hypothetical protein